MQNRFLSRRPDGTLLPSTSVSMTARLEDVEPALAPPAPRPPKRTWIEVQLIGEDNQPIPGVRYRIERPDGSVSEGRLNADGLARVDDLDPGLCNVTFPDLDEGAWVRA